MAGKRVHPDDQEWQDSKSIAKKQKIETIAKKDDGVKSTSDQEVTNKEVYTFFYGNASPFSQWHAANFTLDGINYNCAEQYMMHQKAVLFKDKDMEKKILAAKDPKLQKSLGRKVKNFNAEEWKNQCRKLVKTGNMAKFSQNKCLKEALLTTKGTILVEASPRDRIWGIGLGKNNPKAKDKTEWRGKNWLGYILTDVRNEILKENINDVDTELV